MSQVSRQVAQIVGVLEGVGWNVSHAARRLGVHRNTVLTKPLGLAAKDLLRDSDCDGDGPPNPDH